MMSRNVKKTLRGIAQIFTRQFPCFTKESTPFLQPFRHKNVGEPLEKSICSNWCYGPRVEPAVKPKPSEPGPGNRRPGMR